MNKERFFSHFTLLFLVFTLNSSLVCAESQQSTGAQDTNALAQSPANLSESDKKLQPDASTESFETVYAEGIKLYQTKVYDKAREKFEKAVSLKSNNASALTNLGLTQYRTNQKGLAIANFRKALSYDPDQITAQSALKYALSQLEIKEIPHQIETYETIRANILQPVTLNTFILLCILLLFSSGWTILNYFGKRKKAFTDETAMPGVPVVAIILGVGFVVLSTLAGLKIYDHSLPRATIIADKVSVQTAPGDNQATLIDLYSGFEVIVRNSDQDWIQVTYPGAITGWIKQNTAIITSGRGL